MAKELYKEDLANQMQDRIKQAVRGGLVPMLNVGFPEGKKLHIAAHGMVLPMPAPGDVFEVPVAVADFLTRMPPFRAKVQRVTGAMPQNFTPPPGFKLVPDDVGEAESVEESLDVLDLIDSEQEYAEALEDSEE